MILELPASDAVRSRHAKLPRNNKTVCRFMVGVFLLMWCCAKADAQGVAAELPDLIAACQQWERALSQCNAVLRLTEKYHPSLLNDELFHEWPELKPDGVVRGTLKWMRDGERWRHEIRYDLDEKTQTLGNHIDEIEGFDGERSYSLYPRTRQVKISPPVEPRYLARTRTEVERRFFRPYKGKFVSECLAEGLATTPERTADGEIALVLVGGANATSLRVVLDPAVDYAMTAWDKLDTKGETGFRCAIQYERRGEYVVPVRGRYVHYGMTGSGEYLDPWDSMEFETLEWTPGPLPGNAFVLDIPPKALVADHTRRNPYYKTDESGNEVAISAKHILPNPAASSFRWPVMILVSVCVAAVFLWRIRAIRARAAEK